MRHSLTERRVGFRLVEGGIAVQSTSLRFAFLLLIGSAIANIQPTMHKGAEVRKFTGENMGNTCAAAGSHKGMAEMFHIPGDNPKDVYQLDDQKKPSAFAGEKVRITGKYDSKTETIHVQSIVLVSHEK